MTQRAFASRPCGERPCSIGGSFELILLSGNHRRERHPLVPFRIVQKKPRPPRSSNFVSNISQLMLQRSKINCLPKRHFQNPPITKIRSSELQNWNTPKPTLKVAARKKRIAKTGRAHLRPHIRKRHPPQMAWDGETDEHHPEACTIFGRPHPWNRQVIPYNRHLTVPCHMRRSSRAVRFPTIISTLLGLTPTFSRGPTSRNEYDSSR